MKRFCAICLALMLLPALALADGGKASDAEQINHVTQLPDGSAALTGYRNASKRAEAVIRVLAPDGSTKWEYTEGGDADYTVYHDAMVREDGTLTVMKHVQGGQESGDFLVHFSMDGEKLDEAPREVNGLEYIMDNQYLSEATQEDGTSTLVSYDATGCELWQISGRKQLIMPCLLASADGCLMSSIDVEGSGAMLLTQVGRSGEIQWEKSISLGERTVARSGVVLSDRSIVLIGSISDEGSPISAFALGLSKDGDTLWQRDLTEIDKPDMPNSSIIRLGDALLIGAVCRSNSRLWFGLVSQQGELLSCWETPSDLTTAYYSVELFTLGGKPYMNTCTAPEGDVSRMYSLIVPVEMP